MEAEAQMKSDAEWADADVTVGLWRLTGLQAVR